MNELTTQWSWFCCVKLFIILTKFKYIEKDIKTHVRVICAWCSSEFYSEILKVIKYDVSNFHIYKLSFCFPNLHAFVNLQELLLLLIASLALLASSGAQIAAPFFFGKVIQAATEKGMSKWMVMYIVNIWGILLWKWFTIADYWRFVYVQH